MSALTHLDNSWRRTRSTWHISFAVLGVLSAVLAVTDPGTAVPLRAVTVALLALVCVAYAVLAAPLLHAQHQPRGLLYVVLAGPLVLGMFALQPFAGGVLLFGYYPQLWCLLPKRRAVVATAVMMAVVAVAMVRFANSGWGLAALYVVIGLAFALLIGLWLSRVTEQNLAQTRLVAELERTRTELAEVSREAGILAERERLARDLHDTLAQGETSALLLVRAARTALSRDPADCAHRLAVAEQSISDNLGEIRALVAALTPTALDGVSLPAALRRLGDRIGTELGITVLVEVVGTFRELPASVEVPLFRAAQEAMANVRKHADAGTVTVRLGYEPDHVTLRVADDGRGYDPRAATEGFGLAGLRARTAEAGGTVTVDTAPEAGLVLAVDLPVGALR